MTEGLEWFKIRPRNGERWLWVGPEWEGKPHPGPYLLEDDRDVTDVVAVGDIDELPFRVWFERNTTARDKRRGDILWSGGLKSILVSRHFADAVEELGVTGVKTYEVELIDRRKGPIEGFVGFVANVDGSSEISSYAWPNGNPHYVWAVSARVVNGLFERGIDQFRVEPLTHEARIPRI